MQTLKSLALVKETVKKETENPSGDGGVAPWFLFSEAKNMLLRT